ncbi:MAG: type II toxin-antitoxin system RelB/DinJ family antitoxin [Clostridiales bacterium]|nr:type II toxin-antitoxin system RelB/DinJ family antitoxin [Clostridiales bacterium]
MVDTTITFRAEEGIKQEFEQVCGQIGMNMSTAFNVFMRAVIQEQGFPIDLTNASRRAAFQKRQKKAVQEFIAGVNATEDSLTDADFAELENGNYRLKLNRGFDS